MARKNTLDMTQGPIVKKLFSFAIPVLFTLVGQHLYTVADRAVVGQFAANGELSLAAIGATSSITALIVNMSTGLASGVNVRCAHLRGASNEELLRKSMHTGLLLSVVTGLLLSIFGIVISRPILRILDTPTELMTLSTLYMQVYFIGLPANIIYNFGAAILRSFGDAKRPMYILTTTGVINVLLNLVFVIVLKMDVVGVALATAIAQALSAVCVLWILFSPRDAYQLSPKALRFHKESLISIIKIGVPNGINGIIFSLSNLTVQASINSFKDTAVIAGKTAAMDVSNILYQVIHAFAQACISFSGQCVGAKKYKRIDQLAIKTILFCGALVAGLCVVVSLFPAYVLSIFNDSPEVISAGKSMMLMMCWSYVIYVVSDTFISCSRGFGRSLGVTVMNVVGIILPRLIWIWVFFPMHRTIEFLFLCYPISYVISSITQITYYIHIRKKVDRQLAANPAT